VNDVQRDAFSLRLSNFFVSRQVALTPTQLSTITFIVLRSYTVTEYKRARANFLRGACQLVAASDAMSKEQMSGVPFDLF